MISAALKEKQRVYTEPANELNGRHEVLYMNLSQAQAQLSSLHNDPFVLACTKQHLLRNIAQTDRMQIICAVLAIAGVSAALPGGGDGGYPYGGGGDCYTTSTCKALYFTTTKKVPYQNTMTVTKTEYKPVVYTTQVPKVYTTTAYVPSAYTYTKIIPVTKTITVPDYSTTVICKTSTIPFNRTSTYTTSATSLCPQTKSVPSTAVYSTYCPIVITTSSACPYTTVIVKSSYSPSVCTQSTSKCNYVTSCKPSTKPAVYPTPDSPVYQPEPAAYTPAEPTYKA